MAVRQVHGRASWKKFDAALSEMLGEYGEELTNFGKMTASDACKEWIDKADRNWPHSTVTNVTVRKGQAPRYGLQKFGGDYDHPWYTGNLHDSIVVRVADGNRTIALHYMPQRATITQHAIARDAGADYASIRGAEFAEIAAHNAQYVFLPGIQMQLLIGVPYARKVNENNRHRDFIASLSSEFFSHIEERFQAAIGDFNEHRSRVYRKKKK